MLKDLWERGRISDHAEQQKEQFKRFVPQRRGLGYVEPGSEEYKTPSTSETGNPKAKCSEGIQVVYIDQKITQLFEKASKLHWLGN